MKICHIQFEILIISVKYLWFCWESNWRSSREISWNFSREHLVFPTCETGDDWEGGGVVWEMSAVNEVKLSHWIWGRDDGMSEAMSLEVCRIFSLLLHISCLGRNPCRGRMMIEGFAKWRVGMGWNLWKFVAGMTLENPTKKGRKCTGGSRRNTWGENLCGMTEFQFPIMLLPRMALLMHECDFPASSYCHLEYALSLAFFSTTEIYAWAFQWDGKGDDQIEISVTEPLLSVVLRL